MVDIPSGLGSLQNIPANKSTAADRPQGQQQAKTAGRSVQDQVDISPEAKQLLENEALQASKNVRQALQQTPISLAAAGE